MSAILVTGGTGALGRHVVSALRQRGEEPRVLSRRPGAGTHVGDLTSGAGVDDATRGAELIIHAASDFRRRFGKVDIGQTQRLVAAARDARHLLYVSIVGIDSIPYPYYRYKLECERVVAASGIPYTILRATQFHELLAWPLQAVTAAAAGGVAARLPLSDNRRQRGWRARRRAGPRRPPERDDRLRRTRGDDAEGRWQSCGAPSAVVPGGS